MSDRIVRPGRVACLAAVALMLTACGTSMDGNPTTAPGPSTVTATVTTTEPAPSPATTTAPAPPPVTTTETTTEAPPPATTHRPDPPSSTTPDDSDAQIHASVASAFGVADRYWDDVFAHWKGNHGEAIYWTTPRLLNGDGFYDSSRGFFGTCGSERRPPDNAGFCEDGDTDSGEMAWDIVLMRDIAADGEGALYAVIAHEFGHAAQWRFWVDHEGGATPERPTFGHDSPKYEQQADCIAGVTLARAVQDGYLTIDLDLAGIAQSLIGASDDGSSHGTPAERTDAFKTGYATGDIESCLYNQGQPPPTT